MFIRELAAIAVLTASLALDLGAVTLAWRDANGRLVYQAAGAPVKVVAASNGFEPSLSPDAKLLLYTLEGKDADRTIMLYDSASGKSRALLQGLVRQAMWSPDGRRIAFLKIVKDQWMVWEMPAVEPQKARIIAARSVHALAGWAADSQSVIAVDERNLYWLGINGAAGKSVPIEKIYSQKFQWMSSDTLRFHPRNADLLAVSAFYMDTPKGAQVDAMDLNATIFLYDFKTGTRTVQLDIKSFGIYGEWSPDGEWIYFTRQETTKQRGIWRMHAGGKGLERVAAGEMCVVGR